MSENYTAAAAGALPHALVVHTAHKNVATALQQPLTILPGSRLKESLAMNELFFFCRFFSFIVAVFSYQLCEPNRGGYAV